MNIHPLLQLLLVAFAIAGVLTFAWRASDRDPASGRTQITADERRRAHGRLSWVATAIEDIARRCEVPPLRAPRFSNRGAHYLPLQHRINVSMALCARLSDDDLRLILAHEVGHAARRFQTWHARKPCAVLLEEKYADAFALKAVGATPAAWSSAMSSTSAAESGGHDAYLSARALALGASLADN